MVCDGATSLLIVALLGQEAAARLLRGRRAEMDDTRNDGATSLLPVGVRPEVVARMLLDLRTLVDHAEIDGTTPIITAAQHGREAAACLLLDCRAEVDGTRNVGPRCSTSPCTQIRKRWCTRSRTAVEVDHEAIDGALSFTARTARPSSPWWLIVREGV